MKAFLLIPGVASESLYPLIGKGLSAGIGTLRGDVCDFGEK
jgi:hypothetical protein